MAFGDEGRANSRTCSAFSATPALQRAFTVHVVQAEALAAKWGHVWLRKVFPDGTEHGRSLAQEGACPIRRVFIHGDQEANEVLNASDLQRLEPGAKLLADFPEAHNPVLVPPLHPAFPKDCWLLPMQPQHWSNDMDDHMTIGFSRPARVFILLPSLGQEPRWLRHSFFKLRDPNFMEVQLKVQWRSNLATKLMMGLSGMTEACKSQALRVFKSNKVYHPGEQLVLGGMGLAGIAEVGYAVAVRQEDMDTHDMQRGGSRLWPGVSSNPGNFSLRETVDLESWLQRLIRVVKKGRLVEARLLIETDLARPPGSSHLQQNDINVLPEGETQALLVDLAASNKDVRMVCLLVDRCKCVLSFKALQVIVRNWEDVPALSGTAMGLLVQYLLRHPNPLAIVSAYLMAIRGEITRRFRRHPTTQLEEAVAKFEQLQLVLLRKGLDVVRDSRAEHHQKVLQLEAILDPKYRGGFSRANTMTISCFKPLRVAMHDRDSGFMNAPIVEQFNRLVWQGREYVMETCKDGSYSLSLLDPAMLYVIYINIGFSNAEMPVLEWSARLWHLCTYSSQAFYNSPRARWVMRGMSSTMFVILYLQVINTDLIPDWYGDTRQEEDAMTPSYVRHSTINIALFNAWILGNVVELVQVVFLRYRSNPLKYLTDHPLEMLFFLTDLLMLALSFLYTMIINDVWTIDSYSMQITIMCWASAAPLLWGQCLLPIIPLLERLGPLLGTLKAMMGQVAMFVVPWTLITAGFAVSLNVIYAPLKIQELENFWTTMFLLFQGFADGGPDYDVFQALDDYEGYIPAETLSALRIYGNLMFVAYTVISTIILGNLLIAIITTSYRPDSVRPQSKLSFAEYVDVHQFQVDHDLLCSPFNLVPLALFVLPSGKRQKVHPSRFYRLALAFLDGFVPATPDHPTLARGRSEIPHLIYLLVLPPITWAASVVLYVLHIPISAIYFAVKGHTRVVRSVKAMTSSFGSKNGSEHGAKLGLSASMAPGAVSMAGSGRSQRSAASSIGHSNITASNDAFGVFEGAANTDTGPQLSVWRRLVNSLWKIVAFLGWFLAGTTALCMVGLIHMVAFPIYMWLASLVWSVFHIVGGSIALWTERIGFMLHNQQICPDEETGKACEDFAAAQEERGNLIRQQEQQYKHLSMLTETDVRDCLAQVFGSAFGLGADPSEAGPGHKGEGKLDFRHAGIMSMTARMLSGTSLEQRGKSGAGVAAGVAAIAKAFQTGKGVRSKPDSAHVLHEREKVEDSAKAKGRDVGDDDAAAGGGLSSVLESLISRKDKKPESSEPKDSVASAAVGPEPATQGYQAEQLKSGSAGRHLQASGELSGSGSGAVGSEAHQMRQAMQNMQAQLDRVTELLVALAGSQRLRVGSEGPVEAASAATRLLEPSAGNAQLEQ